MIFLLFRKGVMPMHQSFEEDEKIVKRNIINFVVFPTRHYLEFASNFNDQFMLNKLIPSFLLLFVSFSILAQDQGYQAQLFKVVNELRAEGCKCGRRYKKKTHPLKWNNRLEQSAKSHAQNMNENNFFEHKDPRGKRVQQRATAAGYNWGFIGENIAWGQTTIAHVMKDWIASTSHCNLLMDGDFNEVGIYKSGKYWVINFGRRMRWY